MRKGEKSTYIVFWKIGDKETTDGEAEGSEEEKQKSQRDDNAK